MYAGAVVEVAREHEQSIRQAVEILHHERGHHFTRFAQRDRFAFGTAANRARYVRIRAERCTPRKDETLHRLEVALPLVDARFHLRDFRFVHVRAVLAGPREGFLAAGGTLARFLAREPGAEREKIALYAEEPEDLVRKLFFFSRQSHAEAELGVQLVEGAVGGYAAMRFRNALATEERGLPFIARAGIDLHSKSFTLFDFGREGIAMRHLAWLALIFLVACSHAPATEPTSGNSAAHEPHLRLGEPDAAIYDHLVIVGTNDFHGYLRPVESDFGGSKAIQGGAEWFAGYVDILRRKFGDHLVMLDAGDMYQGTLESNLFHGESVEKYYNTLPYAALAIGNHEFDYGALRKGAKDRLGILKLRMAESTHPFVAANIFVKKTGKVWKEKNLTPTVMITAGGHRVGIIGLTTVNTPATTLPQNVETLEFRDFGPVVLAQAKKLRAAGAELVLITTHEGDGNHPDDAVTKLLNDVPPGTVDAIVSGHTHTESHRMVNGTPVIQSKTQGKYFGRIDLYVSKLTGKVEQNLTRIHPMHAVCGTWFHDEESCDPKPAHDAVTAGKRKLEDLLPLRTPQYEGEEVKPSAAVHALVAPFLAHADEKRKELLGTAQSDFEMYPSGESEMGTLMCDAFHDRYPQARVVVMNGGGIRRRLFKGPITYGDLYEMNPFDNSAVLVKMTGAQLKELLKTQTSGAHGLPAIWGVKVTFFNGNDPKFERDLKKDGKPLKWMRDRLDPENGVVWEKSGKPVGDKETFWVATIDYLAAGGDDTALVFDKIPMSQRKYFDISPRDVAAEYLRKHPGIAEPHKDIERITAIKGEGAEAPIMH